MLVSVKLSASATFKLKNASNGRSKCKTCKGPIGKGRTPHPKDHRNSGRSHDLVGCIPIPRVYKDNVQCKTCKGPIGKDELRIQKIIETPDGRTMAQNYLVGCIPIPRVYKDDVQAFMCDLVDSTDDMMLSNEEGTRQIYDTIMEGRAKAAAKKKSGKKAAAADSTGREKKAQNMPENCCVLSSS